MQCHMSSPFRQRPKATNLAICGNSLNALLTASLTLAQFHKRVYRAKVTLCSKKIKIGNLVWTSIWTTKVWAWTSNKCDLFINNKQVYLFVKLNSINLRLISFIKVRTLFFINFRHVGPISFFPVFPVVGATIVFLKELVSYLTIIHLWHQFEIFGFVVIPVVSTDFLLAKICFKLLLSCSLLNL